MPTIISPKSIATRGRLINIQTGRTLQPAIMLEAKTKNRRDVTAQKSSRSIYAINEKRSLSVKLYSLRNLQPKLEMRYVG